MKFEKITLEWSLSAFQKNLRLPVFYYYIFFLATLLVLGGGALWMAFSEWGASGFQIKIMVDLVISWLLLKAAFDVASFKVTKKLWLAIVFGAIGVLSAVGVLFSVLLDATASEADDISFAFFSLTIGFLLFHGGYFAWCAIERTDAPEALQVSE